MACSNIYSVRQPPREPKVSIWSAWTRFDLQYLALLETVAYFVNYTRTLSFLVSVTHCSSTDKFRY